jgi:hypothetical protein
LAALVARIDRDRPQVVTAAVERLRQRHLVTVGPRRGRSMTGAMVALAESRTPSTPPTRGPAGDDVRRLSPWSRP